MADATVAARARWLPQVEEATAAWRRWRADDYLRRGERALIVDCEAESEEVYAEFREALAMCPVDLAELQVGRVSRTLPVNGWHWQRAYAHLERFERLSECDTRARTVTCECGDRPDQSTVLHCDHWRLCLECQGRRCARYRARFEQGREAALERNHARLCDVRRRWSEKFWTFTVPHSGVVANDLDAMARAWGLLRGSLQRYLVREGYKDKWSTVPYWRSTEVTPSDGGHAHYHVWLLAPFVPVALVRHWWGRALGADYHERMPKAWLCDVLRDADKRNRDELRRAAILDPRFASVVRKLERDYHAQRRAHGHHSRQARAAYDTYRQTRDEASFLWSPVVDVRACDDDTGRELVKYIVKMGSLVDGELALMAADAYAPIYAALDGARIVATSPHWMRPPPPRVDHCECCGAVLEVRVVHASDVRATSPPTARA